jgi:hypothetical protein
MAMLTITEAQAAICSWKRGVFPAQGIENLTVGRNIEACAVRHAFATAANNGSGGLFFEADYGHGKSHMLRMVESMALTEGFAVSWITFDHKSHAFNHPTRYLHGILENLRVPGYCGRGLSRVVELALTDDRREALIRFAATAPWFIRNSIHDLSFGDVTNEVREAACRLLECRDLQAKNGIYYYPEFFSRLQAVGRLMRILEFKGIIWLFDEVECLGKLSNCQSRFAGYSLLNRLLRPNEFPNSWFFFTTTGDFRERLRTEKDPYFRYEGAIQFVKDWREGRCDVHALKRLSCEDRLGLLQSVRNVHSIAYEWDSEKIVTDHFLQLLLVYATKAGLTERELLKSTVSILETCEQHRCCDPMIDLFGAATTEGQERPQNVA